MKRLSIVLAVGLALSVSAGSVLAKGSSHGNQSQTARVYSDTGAGACLSPSGCSNLSILSTGAEVPAGGGETLIWNVNPTVCSAQLKPDTPNTAKFVTLYDATNNAYVFQAPSTGFAIIRVNASARLLATNTTTSGTAAAGLRAYIVDEGDGSVDYAIGNASLFVYALYSTFTGREQSFGGASGLVAMQAGRSYRIYVQGVGFIPHTTGSASMTNVTDIRLCATTFEVEFAAPSTM